VLWRTRRFWLSLLPGLGTAIGLATYCFYNYYRFGRFLRFGHVFAFSVGYAKEGFIGLLVSPGFGLLWFCPCVVLSFVALRKIRERRLEAWAIVALAFCWVLLHSFWLGWFGGWSWGPRLLLPVLPGLVAVTGILRNGWRKTLAGLTVLGFVISAPNLVSYYQRYFAEAYQAAVPEWELRWLPSKSPLVNGWPAALREIDDARRSDVVKMLQERTETPASTVETSRALRVVAVWWWVLPVVHVSRLWGVGVSAVLATCGIWLLVKARSKEFASTGNAQATFTGVNE